MTVEIEHVVSVIAVKAFFVVAQASVAIQSVVAALGFVVAATVTVIFAMTVAVKQMIDVIVVTATAVSVPVMADFVVKKPMTAAVDNADGEHEVAAVADKTVVVFAVDPLNGFEQLVMILHQNFVYAFLTNVAALKLYFENVNNSDLEPAEKFAVAYLFVVKSCFVVDVTEPIPV